MLAGSDMWLYVKSNLLSCFPVVFPDVAVSAVSYPLTSYQCLCLSHISCCRALVSLVLIVLRQGSKCLVGVT